MSAAVLYRLSVSTSVPLWKEAFSCCSRKIVEDRLEVLRDWIGDENGIIVE
jgi:hypothetical protein